MNANDLFPPSQFLKSQDVIDNGGEMELTIKKVDRMQYDDDEGNVKVKGLLEFAEVEQKLALNVTNTRALIAMFGGQEIDKAWIGKPVTLIVEMTKFQGKEVQGIRIKHVDEKKIIADTFWKKCVELYLSPDEGRAHLGEFGGDYAKALASLEGKDIDPNAAFEAAEAEDRKKK